MGAVFAFAAGTGDIITASPDAVATGMRITFAAGLIAVATVIASAVRGVAAT